MIDLKLENFRGGGRLRTPPSPFKSDTGALKVFKSWKLGPYQHINGVKCDINYMVFIFHSKPWWANSIFHFSGTPQAVHGHLSTVDVNPCPAEPCPLPHGKNITLTATFTPSKPLVFLCNVMCKTLHEFSQRKHHLHACYAIDYYDSKVKMNFIIHKDVTSVFVSKSMEHIYFNLETYYKMYSWYIIQFHFNLFYQRLTLPPSNRLSTGSF